ncbi:retention module-containing protein [Methylotenera sp. G11]|uniref:retention module-containing protein n=1 Tax=Methylotenera sp. G11 TaxID=1506585 RepID=UPI000646B4D7|nr:retention module-containing protein [Methylotenera sp. G11]
MALIGRIVGMTGVASLITGNGEKRDLHLGDSIQTGDTIQTPRGVEVDLELANGRVIHISAEQLVAFTEDLGSVFVPDPLDSSINLATIDTVIKAIEEGKDINAVLEETAAGIAGQSNAYGFGFVDLLRISAELIGGQYALDADATRVSDSSVVSSSSSINNQIIGDETAPVINSGGTAAAIDENTGAGQVIYVATATDESAVTFSLGGADSALFSIDAVTGAVTLIGNPDYESQSNYNFIVIATDTSGNVSKQAVTLAVTNLDEVAPTITSGTTATAIAENSGAGQVVYTATATDNADISAGITYSLSGTDAGLFSINSSTGAVTLIGNPNYEGKASYSFTVEASDGVNAATTQAVTLAVTNLDEVAPTITSGTTATAIAENSGAGQVVYTATATDNADISAGITYSLSGTDASLFSINSSTGAVTLIGNPNYEGKASYSFTVEASDGVNPATTQAVTLAVTNLDEVAPTITSGTTATAIAENSGAGQVVYTATATDSADISAGITYSLSGTDASLFSINSSTGAVTLIGNPNYEGKASYSFTVEASDGVNPATTQAVTLAVTNLDEVAPTITSGTTATAIAENSGAGQVVYTATATDNADISAGITYSLSGTDASLFSINSSTGAVTLIGNPNYEGKASYSFTVEASDGVNPATTQAVTLAVTNLDEVAPTITSGTTATAIAENSGAGQVVYTATATDNADISAGITYSLSGTDAGLFSINSSTGAVTLIGNPNYEGKASYSFTVEASDGVNPATTQAVTLAVTNLDEVAPTITSGTTATAIAENSGAGQVVYTATATDNADISAGITYSLSGTDASLFSINSSTGAVTLIGNPNYEGKASYSFTVEASDGVNPATTQAVTLAVTNVDEVAPTITSGTTATAIAENSGAGQVVYTATATDNADISAGITYSLSGTDASLFSINSSTGAVTLIGNPNYEGKASYSFTVEASDGVNPATTQAVTLAVTNVDEVAPTITSGTTATAIAENSGAGQVVYTATATDNADISAGITYSLSGTDASLFSINSSTGAVTLIGNPNYEGKASYSFTVEASDGVNPATTQAVTLAVTNLDEVAPTITSGTTATAIAENSGAGQVVYTATATDNADISAGITYSLSGTDASLFSINSSTGAVTLIGNPNYEGKASYSFTVEASDGVNPATTQAVTLAVTNLDEVAPTITSGTTATAIAENSGAGQVVYTATATDNADISAGITYSLSGTDASLFSINSSTGAVTLIGNPNYEGKASYSFTVEASDGVNPATTQAVTLAVTNVDEVAPTITSGTTATAIAENSGAGQVVYTATATDNADISAGITYSLSGTDASLFSINSSTGAVTLIGNPNYEGKASYSFTVEASDGVNPATTQAVTLAVTNLDEVAPTITSGTTATAIAENSGAGQVVYTATATDNADISAGITYSLSGTDASLFSINSSTGAVTLIGNPNYEGKASYSFTVEASDGVNPATTQAVTLAVTNLDEVAPTITSGTTATAIAENSGAGQVVYTATATDNADISAGITYSLSGTDASLFSINSSTGAVTLIGNPNYEGKASYSFTVEASDGVNAATTQAVTLAVTNLDEVAPTITSGTTATAIAENSGAGQVVYTATATDNADISAGITYSLSGTDASLFSINSSTGAVTLIGNPNYEGKASYSFTVEASDGVNPATTQAVTLAVTNLDEVAPTITSGTTATAIAENSGAGQVVYTATATDNADISAGITYSLSGTDASLFSINSSTGAVTLIGNPNYEGKASYSFTVEASDGVNPATTQAVTLAVTNLDEVAPTITSGTTATAIAENSGAGQVVYTATATDNADISAGITYSLSGTDASLFSINSSTGAVTLIGNPNYEGKASYSFTVEASDGVNPATTQAVTLAVTNVDEVAPTITSGTTATAIAENSGAGQVVYTATATDNADISAGITYSLSGTDASLFSINSSTGAVTLIGNPNYEGKASYSFTVEASDGVNPATTQAVTLAVTNLDEVAPTITSGTTATAIAENSGAGQVVYTATATDNADISAGITYSLSGTDASLFSINSSTGAVTLIGNPNYEGKASYSFTVEASDGVNPATTQAVTLAVTNLDEVAPTITSGTTATAIAENSGAGQVVYTATATDNADISAGITYSLSGTDASLFSINSSTGAVTLIGNPNYEGKASYSFTVEASDGVNPATTQAVTLAVTNLDEVAPTITSGTTATAIAENSGAGQVVYTATATDNADISAGITYSLSGTDASLFSINSSTGAVTLIGNPNYEGKASYSFTVEASDGVNPATTQAVTLAVTNLDEVAPTITSGTTATAIAENSGAGQVVYTATATDNADISAGITYSLSGTDASLFSINSSTGAVTLIGNPNYEGKASYSFTVEASDGVNPATTQAVTLAVTNVDEVAPTITSGTTATAIAENSGAGQVVYTATATDNADISAGITYSLSGTDASLFSINSSTGAVTLIGNPNYEGKASYSFTVEASDGVNPATTQAVTLAVTNVDEVAPTITSGTTATAIAENSGAGQVVYTATATDNADISAGITYSLSGTDASLFSINSSTGAVTLIGNPNYEGKASYSFTVEASDGVNPATTQAVTLAVTNLDEVAPTITSGTTATAIAENSGAGQVVYTATATDNADISAGITYSLSGTDASLFSINSSTGAVTLIGNPNYEGKASYSFTVEASDGVNPATTQAVTLAVTNVDEVAPTITSGTTATAIAENSGAGQVVYTATATDNADISAGITYSLSGTDASLFSINSSTGAVTLIGNPNYEGKASYSFTVEASDGVNPATTQAVTLAVTNLDEVAPTITSGTTATAIAENSGAGQVVYTATATDNADISAGITYSLSGTDAGLFSINSSTGAVTLIGNPNYEGKASYSFTVEASDGVNAATTQAVTLAVTNLDEVAPTITSGTTATAIAENSGAGQVVYTATATDNADISAGITYSLSGTDASLFSINSSTGAVTLIGNPNYEGKASYSFTVEASDGVNPATTQAVTLAVTNLDEVAPTITSGTTATAIAENSGAGQVVYTATATDNADISAGITYSLSGTDASLFSINSSTGAVTLIGNPNYEGKASYSFTVEASDGVNPATTQAVTLAVTNLDEVAPTITSGTTATAIAENSGAGQVVYTATATDNADISAGITYSLSGTDASLFSINSSTGAVTLIGNPNYEGKASYSFTVEASDGVNPATTQAVTLAVTNVDEVAPTITSGTTATAIAENSGAGQVVYTATATDNADISAGITYSLSGTDASLFSINSSTGAVTLIGNPNYEGKASYSFTVEASDGVNPATTQAVTLAVTNVDEVAPTITSGTTATAIAENSGAGQVVYTATATDNADISAGITYSLSGTDASLFSINSSTGAVTLIGNPNYEGKASYSFTVEASDGVNAATTQAVTLAVINLNDNAPDIVNTTVAFDENIDPGTLIYNVNDSFTGTDFDRDGNSITYSITGGNAAGIFEINSATGVITIAAGKTLNYEAATVHNLTITASDGSFSDTATVTVNVNNLVTEAFNDSGAVNENATLTVGTPGVLVNDFDNNANPIHVSAVNGVAGNVGTSIPGTYGSLTLNANGSYTYVANNAESLAAGVTVNDVFNYTISNGLSGADTATLTITITGTNDLPVFSGADTGSVTEDLAVAGGMLTTAGTLIVTDPDSGQSLIDTSVPVISNGNLGTLMINSAGQWTYAVSNDDVQYLAEGQTRSEVFTVTSKDGTTHNITVTITGDQDNPTAQDATIPIPKNATHVLTADDFGIIDKDANDALVVTITSVPGQGLLKYYNGTAWVTVTANTQIPYTNIENGLLVYVPATNDTGNESFTYTVTDGTYTTTGNTVTFSINIELSVSSPLPVDEGKATVFAVELSDPRTVSTTLNLTLGGEATSDDYVTPMQYRIQNADGSYTAWQNVSGSQITLAIGQTRAEVKVKTVVNDDGSGVVSESLTLTATTTAAADLANTSATGETSINDLPSLLVSGASYVSEGNTAIFALELSSTKASATVVSLTFEGVATPGALADYEYSLNGGATWLSLASNTITIPGSTTSNPTAEIQVRTRADALAEPDEVIRLVATTADAGIANSGVGVSASTLIVDPIVVSATEDTALTILSGASYDYAVLGQAAHGTVTNSGGDLIYTPNANWSGTDSFTITKTNEVGLSVTSVVTVNVAAVADAPGVTINVSSVPVNAGTTSQNVITNGDFSQALTTGWTTGNSGGGTATLTSSALVLKTGNGQATHTAYAEQAVSGLTSGQSYTFTVASSTAPSAANGIVRWNGVALTPSSYTGGIATFTVTAGASNTLRLTSPSTAGASVTLDNATLNVTGVFSYTYTVNAAAALKDTDGSETLGNTITITSSNLPAGAVLKLSDGTTLVADTDGSSAYSWTVTRAQAAGLLLTVNKSAGTQFTLTASATSTESAGGTATGSITTALITMPASGTGTANPVPTIADAVATLNNAIQTQNITTSFGDGTNTFSWVTVANSLPKIYANGEVVQYSMSVSPDGQLGTITGTTSVGTVFTLSIALGTPNAVATYTQYTSLQGTLVTASGSNMLTSGNGSELLLNFDAGGGTTVNAVVTGENYIDGTTTTINTNNKYIGASNNLMNPGERVTMDFAGGTSGNAVASMKISFFNFDSASASAPDELTIYGTTVDGSTFTYRVTNASLDANGMYTIVAPGNELIRELVFEAGSQGSFKLGIETISAVNDVPSFTVPLTYALTDASGDTDTGTISVTLGGLSGTSGNDTLNGGANSDVISGDAGNDIINGGAGNDMLNGGAGDDVITGGKGDDVMTGGLGADTFKWMLADAGTAGSPARDVISDFDTTVNSDKLDLRDLLTGENSTNLASFLHFEKSGTDTIVHVSNNGGFSGGYNGANEVQTITLQNVDLVTGFANDQAIIADLISKQKLITD